MDMPTCEIIIVDNNELSLREQILSEIIALALLDKVQLHNGKKNKVQHTKES